MGQLAAEITANCRTCSKKYNRHPVQQTIAETPIPGYTGEIIQLIKSIFLLVFKIRYSSTNRFKSNLRYQNIDTTTNKSVPQNKNSLLRQSQPNSQTIRTILENRYGIQVSNAPPLHITSNGRVDKFHRTLGEITRCIKIDQNITETSDLILFATIEYNRTVQSVTNKKPHEIVHAIPKRLKRKHLGTQMHTKAISSTK